ncbi:hypothetical protein [Hyphococcus sp.]|uniref:hypothetical protein n=1 Tax=Hyphococcus sp. TaxID=2038636 RepID=UPI00208AFA3D|nr:MAG: hypothetical protein DHS20C04_02920 [Marinicaulis sp.]
MTLGRYAAIFAALVMLAWPFALTAVKAAGESKGMISHSSAAEHCQPGKIEVNGDCSYIVLCAQICIGVMPSPNPIMVASLNYTIVQPSRAQRPAALAPAPPDPPPRKLRSV